MSEVYSIEPKTSGKVIIHTSLGELEILLFSNECPVACKNFIQLCLNNYYNKNKFFRVVPKFLIQTGDHTNTGLHNEYAFKEPFPNECNSRLKFLYPGCVAFANLNIDNPSNGSQFFITLDKSESLNNKSTIFGKVAKHSLYNLMKFNNIKTNKNDEPIEDVPYIEYIKVIENPFHHLVPTIHNEENKTKLKKGDSSEIKPKKRLKKNLLSFAGEGNDGDQGEYDEDEEREREKEWEEEQEEEDMDGEKDIYEDEEKDIEKEEEEEEEEEEREEREKAKKEAKEDDGETDDDNKIAKKKKKGKKKLLSFARKGNGRNLGEYDEDEEREREKEWEKEQEEEDMDGEKDIYEDEEKDIEKEEEEEEEEEEREEREKAKKEAKEDDGETDDEEEEKDIEKEEEEEEEEEEREEREKAKKEAKEEDGETDDDNNIAKAKTKGKINLLKKKTNEIEKLNSKKNKSDSSLKEITDLDEEYLKKIKKHKKMSKKEREKEAIKKLKEFDSRLGDLFSKNGLNKKWLIKNKEIGSQNDGSKPDWINTTGLKFRIDSSNAYDHEDLKKNVVNSMDNERKETYNPNFDMKKYKKKGEK
ncbi:hypothetical protein YYE_02035 [Plasmodium vinckei vinckei]|nr:hypothetical protein YYE_02035 [Plasmodium vinckei vinckei]